MLNMNKIETKISKLLSVFTNLINELENAIKSIEDEIKANENLIASKTKDNESYRDKIKEYESLKNNVQNILK